MAADLLIPVSGELLRCGELLRLLAIGRLRALSKGTSDEYHRACERYSQVKLEYDTEAARIGAPPHHKCVVSTGAWPEMVE